MNDLKNMKEGEYREVVVKDNMFNTAFKIGEKGVLYEVSTASISLFFLHDNAAARGGEPIGNPDRRGFKYSWCVTGFPDCFEEVHETCGGAKETFMVSDWITITKSNKNWVVGMDKFVGKTVQIKSTQTHGAIKFYEDGGWSWIYSDGHFRRALPSEIPLPFKFKVGDVVDAIKRLGAKEAADVDKYNRADGYIDVWNQSCAVITKRMFLSDENWYQVSVGAKVLTNWYNEAALELTDPAKLPGYNHGLILYPIVSGAAVQMFNNTIIDTKQKFYGGVDPIEPIFRFVLGDVVDSVEREGAREQASSCLEIKDGGLRVCGSSVKSGLKITNRKQVNGVNWYEVLKPGATTPYNNWFNEAALERSLSHLFTEPYWANLTKKYEGPTYQGQIEIKARQSDPSYKGLTPSCDRIDIAQPLTPFNMYQGSFYDKMFVNIQRSNNPYTQSPVKVSKRTTKLKLKTIKTK